MPEHPAVRSLRLGAPDPDGLQVIVASVAPGAEVVGTQPLVGGVAGSVHRVELRTAAGERTAFVLRITIPERGYLSDLPATARTLMALRATAVPAPEVLWVDRDGSTLGRPAMAMSLLPGRSRSAEVTQDPQLVSAFADAAATLRTVTDLGPFSHLERLLDPHSLLGRYAEGDAPEVPLVDAAVVLRALRDRPPVSAPLELGLCHGDLHIGNVLFDGDRVSGIVDWDGAQLTDPRLDATYAAMDLAIYAGFDVADGFIAAYEQRCGRAVVDRAWWALRATLTTWGQLDAWLPGWNDAGIELDLATAEERVAAWTDRHLVELTQPK